MGRLKTVLDRAMGLPEYVEVLEKQEEGRSRLLPAYQPTYSDGRVPRPSWLRDIFAAFRECPAVYTAIERIGASIGDIPFVLIEAEQNAEGRKFRTARNFYRASRSKTYAGVVEKWAQIEGGKVIRHHPILSVLENPSPASQLTGHMLKAAMVAYLELTGMAYIEKLYSDAERTQLTGLWPLVDPRKMMVVAGETRLIDGYVWVGSTGMIVFKPEDMIFMRAFNPDSPFYGYSPTQVLRTLIAGDIKAINWNYVFFDAGAVPRGVLSTDQRVGETDIDLILATWDDAHRGEENWHRPAVLGQGMKWQDIGAKPKDMDFGNLRQKTKEEIWGAYGMPPIVGGDYRDANRASSDVMYRLYFEGAILPRCDMIEDVLNMALLEPGSGLRLVFDLGAIEALKGDVLEMSKVGARVIKQYWSPNEVRQFLWNLPLMEGDAGNDVWDIRGEEVIGRAPSPSETAEGNQMESGE